MKGIDLGSRLEGGGGAAARNAHSLEEQEWPWLTAQKETDLSPVSMGN